ncbi:hypothetical protein CcCBS67573_g06458 [Chytriomyces confervae]|uniref:Uncharacterized protein n=1 Tax=Chytriomyces confervae TaxID=246404 RepID=A0A507F532_9FUNG|nr:hypothetical protein HDU80_003564 [Chytriomyces hyalinus]TPX70730.1 hypothetical protein CcCBS67573_g06458 [Chytriomyces confervae]
MATDTGTVQQAAFSGALSTVRSLIEAQPTSIKGLVSQQAALHWAASGKHVNVAEYLIEKGADVNALDDADWTPLMIAVSVGSAPLVDFLLQNGADVNLQNENKQTPLFYAASKGWLDVCQLLISHGAKINVRDHLNQTALHRACAKGNVALVRLLLEQNNIKLDIDDRDGNSALHIAIDNGHGEVAVLLVDAGADVDSENREKKKPLDLATDGNLRLFLEKAWKR